MTRKTSGQQPRAAIYTRISQDREGKRLGVEDQRQRCLERARRAGYRVVAEYEDNDISASTKSRKPRPRFAAMLDDGRSKRFDVVVAYSNSRLTRRLRELLDLIDYHRETGVWFETVVSGNDDLSTADGRMVAQIKGSVDQAESERIGERVRNAAERRAVSGANHGGRRAFGYAGREHERDGLRPGIDVIESEAAEIRKAADALLSGVTLRGIVKDLNARGVPTVTGCSWTPNAFRDIMLRPRNAGLVVHRGEVVPDAHAVWEPVYDVDTHERVVRLLTDPNRRTSTGNAVRWLGSNIYRCGVCGGPLRCTKAGANRAPAYRCARQDTGGPSHVQRDAAQLDDHVVAALLNRLDQPGVLAALRKPADDPNAEDPRDIVRDIDRMETRLRLLTDSLLDDDSDVAEVRAAIREQKERIAAREAALLDSRQSAHPVLSMLTDGPTVTEVWVDLTLEQQRALLDLLAVVTVERPTRRGRPAGPHVVGTPYPFDTASIRIDWR